MNKIKVKWGHILLLLSGGLLVLFALIYPMGLSLESFTNVVSFRPSTDRVNKQEQNNNNNLWSTTVDMPLIKTTSCQNMCGPQAQCALTREQCTSDIDCQGCQKLNEYNGYEAPSQLTKVPNWSLIENGSDNPVQPAYEGDELHSWKKAFNVGMQLYNQKMQHNDRGDMKKEGDANAIQYDASYNKLDYYKPKYPMTISATGLFYETTPPAANSSADIELY